MLDLSDWRFPGSLTRMCRERCQGLQRHRAEGIELDDCSLRRDPPMYGQRNGHGLACCVTDRVVAVVTILHNAAVKFKCPRRRQEGLAGVVLRFFAEARGRPGLHRLEVSGDVSRRQGILEGDGESSGSHGGGRPDGIPSQLQCRVITWSSVLRNRALRLQRPIASTRARTRRTSAIPRAIKCVARVRPVFEPHTEYFCSRHEQVEHPSTCSGPDAR